MQLSLGKLFYLGYKMLNVNVCIRNCIYSIFFVKAFASPISDIIVYYNYKKKSNGK